MVLGMVWFAMVFGIVVWNRVIHSDPFVDHTLW
jgi:hypothetical protein